MILPGTGIPIQSIDGNSALAPTTLMICGESPSEIFAQTDRLLSGWSQTTLCWGFREFYCRRYDLDKTRLNVFVGGLGSASVELILQEATLAGSRQFILTGSCATLNPQITVGSFVLPQHVLLRPGSFSEYIASAHESSAQTPLQAQLEGFLKGQVITFQRAVNVSTDAFYGMGGAYDAQKRPIYAGAPLKNGVTPESLPFALENHLGADTLDMECGTFFALGHLLDGVDVAALKVVSNAIPWDENFNPDAIAKSLAAAVKLGLGFALTCASEPAS